MKKQSLMNRLRAKKQLKSIVYNVAWYTEENWIKVKQSSTDPDLLEPTYSEWLAMANEAFSNIIKSGMKAEKFLVNADDLLAWCLLQNLPNNSSARASYVSEKMQEKNTSGNAP